MNLLKNRVLFLSLLLGIFLDFIDGRVVLVISLILISSIKQELRLMKNYRN